MTNTARREADSRLSDAMSRWGSWNDLSDVAYYLRQCVRERRIYGRHSPQHRAAVGMLLAIRRAK